MLFSARRRRNQLTDDQVRATWQVVSLLLDYPGEDFAHRLELTAGVIAQLPDPLRVPLQVFTDFARSRPLATLQTEYVATFDHNRRCALYLTYFSHGDTRKRGLALLRVKQVYAEAGVRLRDDELPDHLCVLLEFGAITDPVAARQLLDQNRVGVELLHRALGEREARPGQGWSGLLAAVCATLPDLGTDHEAALARLIADGPPNEEVGLDGHSLDGYALDPALSRQPAAGPVDLGSTIRVGAAR